MRLDKYLIENKYFESRNKAIDCIKNGFLKVNNNIITKPSYEINDNVTIEILDQMKYVSRAGDKLDFAINKFKITLKDKIVVDIGSSTGGFTDCCLQHSSKKVYCIDVGTNQLVDKIRNDERTVVFENTNARYLTRDFFNNETIDFICMDVSFISCTLLLPIIANLLDKDKEAVILVKPQFEVGSKNLDKHGVVKNEKEVKRILDNIFSLLPTINLIKLNCDISPIIGKEGNREYLLYVRKI